MCDMTEACDTARGDGQIGYAQAGTQNLKNAAPSFRDRLERRRNLLTRQLAQVEAALQLVYTNPDAEKIHELLNRSGV